MQRVYMGFLLLSVGIFMAVLVALVDKLAEDPAFFLQILPWLWVGITFFAFLPSGFLTIASRYHNAQGSANRQFLRAATDEELAILDSHLRRIRLRLWTHLMIWVTLTSVLALGFYLLQASLLLLGVISAITLAAILFAQQKRTNNIRADLRQPQVHQISGPASVIMENGRYGLLNAHILVGRCVFHLKENESLLQQATFDTNWNSSKRLVVNYFPHSQLPLSIAKQLPTGEITPLSSPQAPSAPVWSSEDRAVQTERIHPTLRHQ